MPNQIRLHIVDIESQDPHQLVEQILADLAAQPFDQALIELANRHDQTLAKFEFKHGYFRLTLFPTLTPRSQPHTFDTLVDPHNPDHLQKLKGSTATHTFGIPELVKQLAAALANEYQRLQVKLSPKSQMYIVPEASLMVVDFGFNTPDAINLDILDPDIFCDTAASGILYCNPHFLGSPTAIPPQPTWLAYNYQRCNLEQYPQFIDDLYLYIQNVNKYYRLLRGFMFIRDRQVLPEIKKTSISSISDISLAPPPTIISGISPEKYFLTAVLRKKHGLDLKKLFNLP
jgi:hypothetical protein